MKKLSKNAKKQILNISFLLFLIAVTVVVLVLSNRELNFANILAFIKGSNYWYLIAAFLFMILMVMFEGLSILVISRTMGHKCKFVSSMAYSTADLYYSAITPSATGGQPASAYYMVKDGMNAGTASFTLIFNIIAYTASLLVLTVAAFIIRPSLFAGFEFWVKFFIIIGIVVQTLLLGFFIACMYWHRGVLKVCNGLISLLAKMHIVKKVDRWRGKIAEEVSKYASCVHEIKKHRLMFLNALLLNICMRVSRVLISCFVCMAADPDAPFLTLFAMESFVTVGYTSIPLPGGVGIFEFIYLRVYDSLYQKAFLLPAMMVMRVISFYLCVIVTGVFTLSYHVSILRRKPKAVAETAADGHADTAEDGLEDTSDTPDYEDAEVPAVPISLSHTEDGAAAEITPDSGEADIGDEEAVPDSGEEKQQ